MSVINLDSLSLMAFSSNEVIEAWREEVLEAEAGKNHDPDITTYQRVAHEDTYSQTAHKDTYTQTASRDTYNRVDHRDVYSETTARDYYNRVPHTDAYSQNSHANVYSQQAHTDAYSRTVHRDTYTQRAHQDAYTRTAARDAYTEVAHTNVYSLTAERDTYSQVAHVNTYSRVTARDTYSEVAHTNVYSLTAARDTYAQADHRNTYYRVAARDSYSEVAHRNVYTRTAARDTYYKVAHVDTYTEVAHANSYSETAHRNTYYLLYAQRSHADSYYRVAARYSYSRSGYNAGYDKRYSIGTGYFATYTAYSRTHRNSYYRLSHADSYYQVAYRNYYYTSYSRTDHRNTYYKVTRRDDYSETVHINTYSRADHANTYSQTAARDTYTEVAHANTYSESASRDTYTQADHVNTYSQTTARDTYTEVAHRNTYSQTAARDTYTEVAHRNTYSQTAARDSYSRSSHTDAYSRSAHVNSYARTAHVDSYSQVSARDSYSQGNHTNVYSRTATKDEYTQIAHRDTYTKTAGRDVYTQVAHTDSYSKVAARDTYNQVAAQDSGFDHVNYIPTAPEVYNLDGKLVTEDSLGIHLASYDKNNDGFGSQDEDSLTIYYTVKIRQVLDLAGNELDSEWTVLQEGTTTEDFNLDISSLPDGIYELSTQAYNLPRTEKGITKTYVSDEKITTFTISESAYESSLTIVNANEFMEYAYGLETYINRDDEVKKYVDSIIYANSDNQKGLFLEITLDDIDINTYHTAKAALVKGDEVITDDYDIVFETDGNGNPKPGDKDGIVFIPLDDMMDNGAFEDVQIRLKVTEYRDSALTDVKVADETHIGMSAAKDIVYIDIDNKEPTIVITDPAAGEETYQNVNIAFSDTGLGVRSAEYQIVDSGEPVKENDWTKVSGDSVNLKLNVSGTYDIYAKVIDNAGNETTVTKTGYKIVDKKATLAVPSSIYQGSKFEVIGTVYSDSDISDVTFWIENYTEPKSGTLKSSDPAKYKTNLQAPNTIPIGNHIVFMEITFEDGTTQRVSQQIEVARVNKSDKSNGLRFISEEFLNTIPADSKWSKSENNAVLRDSLSNENPEEESVVGVD